MLPSASDFVAFEGPKRIAYGPLDKVVRKAKTVLETRPQASVLVLQASTSRTVEMDYRGNADQVVQRMLRLYQPADAVSPADAAAAAAPPGPGRPRLGVVAREVTLLPRHWEWLNSQPGGASVALRKLVELARKAAEPADRARQAQESAYRFMSTMVGNLKDFEEASRALFAADAPRFTALLAAWPADVRNHLQMLAAPVFEPHGAATQEEQTHA